MNAAKRTSGVQNSCALDLNDCRSLTFPTAIFSHDCLNDEDKPPSSSPELASVLTRALSRDSSIKPRCNVFTWLHSHSSATLYPGYSLVQYSTPPFRGSRSVPLISANHNLATHRAHSEAIPAPAKPKHWCCEGRIATNTVATLCAFSSRSFKIAFASSAILQIFFCDSGRS